MLENANFRGHCGRKWNELIDIEIAIDAAAAADDDDDDDDDDGDDESDGFSSIFMSSLLLGQQSIAKPFFKTSPKVFHSFFLAELRTFPQKTPTILPCLMATFP